MPRPIFLFLALALVFSAGCKKERTDFSFYHPNKPFTQWEEDMDHCRMTVYALKNSDRLQQDSVDEGIKSCMEAKGYVYGYRPFPVPTPAEPGDTGEFVLLESTWHSRELAQKRADYLERTGVWNVMVQQASYGDAGVWQQVVVGPHDTIREAERQRYRLEKDNGLNELIVIKKH